MAKIKELSIPFRDHTITANLSGMDHSRSDIDRYLLLTFSGDRHQSLSTDPYRTAADFFVENGHLALSFDLPNHGSQINHHGEGITGFRNAVVNGEDPFLDFTSQGRAVIDLLVRENIVQPGRIAVCGTSRGGYMALRLLAADHRIAAAAGFAPVTDWRDLTEFKADTDRQDVKSLSLTYFADLLASKPIFLVIGNHDQRVNTASCCRLYLEILKEKTGNTTNPDLLDFYCTEDPGHSCDKKWYRKGAEFLLRSLEDRG